MHALSPAVAEAASMAGEKRLTAIDICCGAGGFSCGFMMAGFDVLMGIDFSAEALTTYCYNLGADDLRWIGNYPDKKFRREMWGGRDRPPLAGDDPMLGGEPAPEWAREDLRERKEDLPWRRTVKAAMCMDIQDVHGWDILSILGVDHIDCVIGSPPCQSFSKAGKQEVGDPRDNITFEFARLVLELQPTFMAMENVPEVATKKLPSGVKIIDVMNKLLSEPYLGPTAAEVLGLPDYRHKEGYGFPHAPVAAPAKEVRA